MGQIKYSQISSQNIHNFKQDHPYLEDKWLRYSTIIAFWTGNDDTAVCLSSWFIVNVGYKNSVAVEFRLFTLNFYMKNVRWNVWSCLSCAHFADSPPALPALWCYTNLVFQTYNWQNTAGQQFNITLANNNNISSTNSSQIVSHQLVILAEAFFVLFSFVRVEILLKSFIWHFWVNTAKSNYPYFSVHGLN